jgi:AAA domain-containing protein
MPDEAKLLDGLTVAERWEYEPSTELWKCGDLVIALEGEDPTRFYVKAALEAGSKRLFSGYVPPSGNAVNEFGWFTALFVQAADGEPVPTTGLEPWFEKAQERADNEYLRREEERQQALRELPGRTAEELLSQTDAVTDWLVPGFLKRGWTTKVGGREKQAGKGTLVTHLLGKLERGEATVFGDAAAMPVTALIYTEEPADSIREKVEMTGLRHARILFGYELGGLTWKQKIHKLVEQAQLGGCGIVFVDNVSRAAAIEDESGVELGRAVEPLQEACREAGLTLIIDAHHKKGRAGIEDKTRGGTALQGAVDINVEIERIGGQKSRKRKLTAFGRVRASHWQKVIELSEDGSEYTLASDDATESVDTETQHMFLDAETLREYKEPITSEEFAAKVRTSKENARRRLNTLADAGLAKKHEGSGRIANRYEAVRELAVHHAP